MSAASSACPQAERRPRLAPSPAAKTMLRVTLDFPSLRSFVIVNATLEHVHVASVGGRHPPVSPGWPSRGGSPCAVGAPPLEESGKHGSLRSTFLLSTPGRAEETG